MDRHRTTSADSNASTQELNLWRNILQGFVSFDRACAATESSINRLNKVHSKVTSREAAKEGFTIKAGLRIEDIYKQAIEVHENELRYSHKTDQRIVSNLLEKIGMMKAEGESGDSGLRLILYRTKAEKTEIG